MEHLGDPGERHTDQVAQARLSVLKEPETVSSHLGRIRASRARTHMLFVAALAVACLSLAACGSSSPSGGGGGGGAGASGGGSGGAKGDFVVGTVQPLSGTYQAAGVDIVHGLEAEAAILNQHGGILGHHVTVVSADDGSSEQRGISATKSLILSHKLSMFEPGVIFGSSELPLVSNLLSVNLCAAAACGDGAKYPKDFTMNPPAANQVPSVLAYAKAHGLTKVGILATTDPAGQGFTQVVNATAKAAGLTVTKAEGFDPAATDVSAQLQALKGSGAQALLTWAAGTSIGPVMKGMQSLGWSAPVLGTPTIFTAPVDSFVPKAVQHQLVCLCYRVGVREGSSIPSTIAPLVAKLKTYGTIESMQDAGLAADTLALAAYGYQKAGKLDASAAATAIQNIGSDTSYPGSMFWGYRHSNPGFKGTVHSPAEGNLAHGFYSAATVSPLISGTYKGKPFNY